MTTTVKHTAIEIKLLKPAFYEQHGLPYRATVGSAGIDLRAAIDEPQIILPNETWLIPTGLAFHISDPHLAGLILPRSGLGHCHDIVLGNLVGLIDSDYQGELKISCWNRSNDSFNIRPGDRIAQLILVQIAIPSFTVVQDFTESVRGSDGFGSTGR